MATSGTIFQQLGIILLAAGLFLGALIDDTLPVYVRLGMLIALALLFAFKF